MNNFRWPLIQNNITDADKTALVKHIMTSDRFTQGEKVKKFEQEWSKWLGVKHSIFVSSGSAANFLTLSALRDIAGVGEVIVPPLTWVSDVVSIIENGFTPVFVDINPETLALDYEATKKAITKNTKAVFLTHILGLNGLSTQLQDLLKKHNIPLIEDACESHGAKMGSKKVGSIGFASNFSFYYGHHMTTIEGGMVCSNDPEFAQLVRIKRGHGLLRESTDPAQLQKHLGNSKQVYKEFDFPVVGFNFRNNELGAVLGLNQLKRLDKNNTQRSIRLQRFLKALDKKTYFTQYNTKGSSSYALLLQILPEKVHLKSKVEKVLMDLGVEYRRGMSGGGNQLRQGFLKTRGIDIDPTAFVNTEQIHHNGFYIGNFPSLPLKWIDQLCKALNEVAK
ncbi:CDP-4-keto-6-deoxy-D-glucose-3-dehydrase [Bdellovibrio sp. ZAP7]|uniref:DegT/DnrJ/EryC1/StrS family aminotransferase n=1 Tax=Bdellovibrio sp. ZAP7 TaxID=2231053 RepID=UPI00115BADC4|nr:DegT/DnrJ/EryC1/StrS aminotransferase family protein [Bdellovibrio sp. ZAP7]QDK47102.1 CDP-4-keto-6-deoxy-D-glucose-3-dehydrase [Bdellovibrio sp. ZAP7]